MSLTPNIPDQAFLAVLPDGSAYIVVHHELEPVTPEQTPTGRLAVLMQTKGHHRIMYLEKDAEGNWDTSGDCEGISQETIDWIGKKIEYYFD